MELSASTVAQLVRGSGRQVEDLVSNPSDYHILICSGTFFLLCYPDEALEDPISTVVCTIIMLIQKRQKLK